MKTISKYPISVFLTAALWTVCLINVPETPLNDVTLIDKWTHIVMFMALCLAIWHEWRQNHKGEKTDWCRLLFWAWLMPLLMGGAVEPAQAYCTGGRRTGDWIDVVANAIGCTLALVAGAAITWKNQKRSQKI